MADECMGFLVPVAAIGRLNIKSGSVALGASLRQGPEAWLSGLPNGLDPSGDMLLNALWQDC